MELIALVVVLAVLSAVVLAPIALVRACAAGRSAAGLEREVDRLAKRLRSVELRLSAIDERERVDRVGASAPAELTPEPIAPARADDPPAAADAGEQAQELSTLEVLRAARQRAQANRPTQPTDRTPAIDLATGTTDADAREPESGHSQQTRTIELEPVSGVGDATPPTTTPERKLSLEELLAGKVFVWIGAVALVLTAAFLLKLGFDSGIITEPVRVIGATAFGLALWAAGAWMRRRVPLISQALCGASVAVLYASVLAGHSLYGLIGGGWAFTMMAAITAGAVVLSLRHGPWVALLGMVGGFMLPPVLAGGLASPTLGMVLYLLALEVGVVAVTGRRGWFGLSTLALVFSIVWSLVYTFVGDGGDARLLTSILIIGSAVIYIVNHAVAQHADTAHARSTRGAIGLAIAGVTSAAAVVGLLVATGGFAPRELALLGLVGAGALVLARLDRRYRAMPFVLMGLSALVIFAGIAADQLAHAQTPRTLMGAAIAYGGLFLLGGYACLWRSPDRRWFTLLSVLAGPVFFALVILAARPDLGWREPWWPYALLLAAVYAVGLVPLLRRRRAEHDWPIAAFALAVFGLICVAILLGLNHPRVAVCLALMAAVAALVDHRLFIRPLLIAGCAVGGLAAVLLVAPGPFAVDIQGVVVFNTLLPMYALPAFGFGVIAWCATRAGEHRIARGMTRLTAATLAGLLVVLTRQAFQPGDLNAEHFTLYEWAGYACVLMLGAFVGLYAASRYKLPDAAQSVGVVAVIGAVVGLVGALVPGNPLIHTDAVGGHSLALGLIALYLIPAWLMWLWARRHVFDGAPPIAHLLRAIAIVMTAAFVGLQVRNAFHAGAIQAAPIGPFECATYALCWMLLGAVLQLIGWITAGPPTTRIAGRAVFGVGLASAIVGNALLLNPLWSHASVGTTPVFNGLWYLFVPAIVALALLARRLRRRGQQHAALLAGYTAIAIGFLLLSLLVRQGFSVDGVLHLDRFTGSAERYAYSLAWVLLGAALLVAGVFTRLDTLRYGSLAILLIAVGKVFLIDTASLDNLYRVFSFFGLGVTLIALGYLYQRLVFRRPAALADVKHTG